MSFAIAIFGGHLMALLAALMIIQSVKGAKDKWNADRAALKEFYEKYEDAVKSAKS